MCGAREVYDLIKTLWNIKSMTDMAILDLWYQFENLWQYQKVLDMPDKHLIVTSMINKLFIIYNHSLYFCIAYYVLHTTQRHNCLKRDSKQRTPFSVSEFQS